MITFLLGSGISLGAEMPSVSALTERLLAGTNLIRYAGTFAVVDDSSGRIDRVADDDPTLLFVQRLHERAGEFYSRFDVEREITYEDVAYLAAQLDDCLMFEYENPALLPLIDQLAGEVGSLERLKELASDAVELFGGAVWSLLGRPAARIDYLACITDACVAAHHGGEQVALVTLNHDTVLEQALRAASVAYNDGFGTRITAEIDAWDDDFDNVVRLYKPHGSVNWYRIYVDQLKRQAAIRTDAADPYHLTDDDGNRLDFPVNARGQFLAGTFNKIFEYQRPVYFEQLIGTYKSLRESKALVVIGYGFGDKAINTRIIDWLASTEGRLILVHRDPERAIAPARPALQRAVVAASKAGCFASIPKWVEETTWADIEADLP